MLTLIGDAHSCASPLDKILLVFVILHPESEALTLRVNHHAISDDVAAVHIVTTTRISF